MPRGTAHSREPLPEIADRKEKMTKGQDVLIFNVNYVNCVLQARKCTKCGKTGWVHGRQSLTEEALKKIGWFNLSATSGNSQSTPLRIGGDTLK
jgi:hypothetical protein